MRRLYVFIVAAMMTLVVVAQDVQVRVSYYTPRIVRIEKTVGDFRMSPSVSVTAQPQDVERPEIKVAIGRGGVVTFMDAKGHVLLQEGPSNFEPIETGIDKGYWKAGQSWILDADEPIYGVGMLQNGKMSQRGENRTMIQSNTEDYANSFQSIKGYGIFVDNYSPTEWSDDGRMLNISSQVAESIDYYFIYGGDADGVVAGLRWLTGKVPMIPMWTYGFHQSRERYKSQKELLDVVKGYRAAGVPLDGIIQDWQYWGNNYLWNAMEFLNAEFPDAKDMVKQTHAMNAHMSISIWQSFGPQTKQFRELDDRNLLLDFLTWPNSGLAEYWPPRMDYPSGVLCYDAYSDEARDIYWKYLSGLYDLGIDAWWMDSTDPDHHDFKESDLDQSTAMGSFRSVRNIYPLMCVEGVYDHQRAVSSDKRVFILTRSYFTGQQRTGANTWSGDVQSTWNDFRAQIPLCLNYTLTGSPYVNSDIGGFFPSGYNRYGQTQTCSRNPLFQELYVRWLQFGVFNPMMRSHGESSRREIWEFGQKGEPIYDAIGKAIRLRYSLLPYIYSTAWQVSDNDDSFMRALMMDFKADRKVWDMNDEFMFGRSLLVAPVTHALYTTEERRWSDEKYDWTEARTMDVYLPSGAKWYDYYDNRLYGGGQNVTVDASIDHCPLFVKAGSILPMGPDVQYASEKPWDNLEIRVYAGENGKFTLYEDEGDNYNYEQGKYTTIEFSLRGSKLTIGKRSGEYQGMLKIRRFNITYIDGKTIRTKSIEYDGNAVDVRF